MSNGTRMWCVKGVQQQQLSMTQSRAGIRKEYNSILDTRISFVLLGPPPSSVLQAQGTPPP